MRKLFAANIGDRFHANNERPFIEGNKILGIWFWEERKALCGRNEYFS